MEETRFEKLKKLRLDIEQEKRRIARTKAAFEERLAKQKEEFNQKLKKLQEGLRVKEQRLREEENLTVIGDVEATNISPEALAKLLEILKTGALDESLKGLGMRADELKPVKAAAKKKGGNGKNEEEDT